MESNDGMFPLTINIKKEKFDPAPQTISRVDFTSDSRNKLSIDVNISNIVSYEKEKKVSIEPLKSSNEILTELFKVFNAAPPENLLTTNLQNNNKEDGDKKSTQAKKSKKHKHKKKKHKSKKDKDSSEPVKEEVDKSSSEESKEKPNRKHSSKKEDIDDKKSKKKKKKRDKSESIAGDKEKAIIVKSGKRSDADSLSENERATKCNHRKSKNSDSLSDNETSSRYKLKKRSNSDSLSENEVPSRHRPKKQKNGDSLSENEVSSRNTHSTEEYHYKDRDFYKSYESAIKLKDSKSNRKHNSSSSSSRNKEYQDYGKKSHYRDRERLYSPSRSRSRSRSTDIHSEKIDKKRLLEIARKNAITMMKNGSLPGSLVADEKNKLISNMRYEGKSVAELTEYCKKLSNCESLGDLSNISSDGDSDHDKHGNEKAFNHPFQIKDRGPIIMNIKNSTPLPPKTAQQNKAIILQFPVSSGKQHRVNENEWVPVSPKRTAVAPAPVLKSTPTPPQEPVVIPPKVIVEPTYGTQASPPIQPLCPPPNPPLLPYNSETKSTVFEDISVFYGEEQQRTTFAYPKPTDTSVFPNFEQDCNLDVAQIIAQRLNAMRKLQDNPTDEGAKQLLNNAQKDMSTWASSKFTPGQFLGSHSDANILTPKELSSGYTPWAKKDQLITTNPVSGMGMHLLQKMGWRPGEGLGKDKSGSLQPLLLEVKLDKRGLVAEEENPRLKKPVPKVQPQLRKTLDGKHPVSLLGELSSKRKWGPPQYDVVMECGPGHAKSFIFKVRLNGVDYQPSIASNNKKDAKATAAKFCLQQLGFLPT